MENNNFDDEKKTILIVDDEQKIVDLLVHNLTREGYNTIEANDGQTAIDLAISQRPDLILLDVMIPRVDGLTVCKKIKNYYNVPILMVSAKDDELDKIVGLEIGADDYITKPFSVREVVARVKANLRKSETHYDSLKSSHDSDSHKETKKLNTIKIGDLTLDLEKYEVNVNGTIVNLTLREFEVLKYLAQQQGQVVTRESLLEQVWGYEYYGDIRTVDVTVRRIRERIEKDTSNPKYLITKRGIGYYIPIFSYRYHNRSYEVSSGELYKGRQIKRKYVTGNTYKIYVNKKQPWMIRSKKGIGTVDLFCIFFGIFCICLPFFYYF